MIKTPVAVLVENEREREREGGWRSISYVLEYCSCHDECLVGNFQMDLDANWSPN
jgi:hypothetical protein